MTSLCTFEHTRTWLDDTSWYIQQPLPDESRCTDYKSLWELHPTVHATVHVWGKTYPVPRFMQAYGHDYNFSKSEHHALPLGDPYLTKLLAYANQHDPEHTYNGMLVNWYRNGNDYIGPHSDDESELTPGSNIYSFTFGATRDFVFKHKTDGRRVVCPLADNTMLIMGGTTQQFWRHSVPKRAKCTESRVNVTIRSFVEQHNSIH